MFNLSGSEFVFILLAALVLLGPEKLPETLRKVGRVYAEVKKISNGFQSEIRNVLDEPTREIRNAFEEPARELRNTAEQARSAFNLGGTASTRTPTPGAPATPGEASAPPGDPEPAPPPVVDADPPAPVPDAEPASPPPAAAPDADDGTTA